MIMMSDDLRSEEHGDGARRSMGNVTHPFVTQTYRCVAPYETKDTKNRPFKVTADEKLDVLIKDPAGQFNFTSFLLKIQNTHYTSQHHWI